MSSYSFYKDKGNYIFEIGKCTDPKHIHSGQLVLKVTGLGTHQHSPLCLHSRTITQQLQDIERFRIDNRIAKTKVLVNPTFKALIDKGVKVVHDFRCPDCKEFCDIDSQVQTDEKNNAIFTGNYPEWGFEPGMAWLEHHKCKCNTEYIIINGC